MFREMRFNEEEELFVRHAASVRSEPLKEFIRKAVACRTELVMEALAAVRQRKREDGRATSSWGSLMAGIRWMLRRSWKRPDFDPWLGSLGFDQGEQAKVVDAIINEGATTSGFIRDAVVERVDDMAARGETDNWIMFDPDYRDFEAELDDRLSCIPIETCVNEPCSFCAGCPAVWDRRCLKDLELHLCDPCLVGDYDHPHSEEEDEWEPSYRGPGRARRTAQVMVRWPLRLFRRNA